MKRRTFLGLLGAAPLAAVVPAVAVADTFRMTAPVSTQGRACTVSLQVDTTELRAELTKISEEVTARYTSEIYAATARQLRGVA
ncbi:hypothetical protein [Phyllobacterium phragmitis]|nr:hypothetical protein [Phyllobacterium phragmitis]